MSHLTRDELLAFWRTGAGDRDRVVAHLATCDACGALYGELIAEQDAPAAAVAVAELAARGRAVYAGRRSAGRAPWRLPAVRIAALAAAVLAAILLLPRAPRPSPAADGAPALRGVALRALAPAGEAVPPLHFRWASALAATAYRIEVRDGAGRVVLERTTSAVSLALADEALTPGASYAWRVVALDARGEPLSASAWQPFVVAR
jgi:hypothetical protein